MWNYVTTNSSVYSNYDNNQLCSPSVSASNTKTYRFETDIKNLRVGITLNTSNGGKKAYYNYW